MKIRNPIAGMLLLFILAGWSGPVGATRRVGDACSPPEIRFDTNRNGSIEFGESDISHGYAPFRFWLNTDRDFTDLFQSSDSDPGEGSSDSSDDVIDSSRDLEDFATLAIRLPTQFDPGDRAWAVDIYITPVTGDPAIRLFPASSSGAGYLTSQSVAQSQVSLSRSRRGIRIGSLPVPLDNSLFANPERVAYFVFEGLSKGSGPLTVHLYKSGQCDSSDQGAYLNLAEVTDFYDHWTVGDSIQNGPHALQLLHAVRNEEAFTNDYVLFVHGWNVQPWKRRALAETAYKRMWHQGFRGGFGLFSWPTEWVPLPYLAHLSFERSELRAWMSAPGLLEVLLSPILQPYAGRLRVFAHSLGNVVVSEALRLGAETGRSGLVHAYIATQAAVPASAYDTTVGRAPDVYSRYPVGGEYYFSRLGRVAENVINFINEDDFALGFWRINNALKPDRILGYRHNGRSEQFFRNSTLLRFPENRYEIFSFAARSSGGPLGATQVRGVVNRTVDLKREFGFGGSSADHSGQFMGNIQTIGPYWARLLNEMDVKH
jgi:hypothetical protein